LATRQHNRGPHPEDAELFSSKHLTALQAATDHLSWLLSRGYASPSSLKLVGDRFGLVTRQRTAVMRSACSDQSLAGRQSRAISAPQLAGRDLEIDALNLLITIEAALSGGVVLEARDGSYRDMASIHGSYRQVSQTSRAIALVGRFLSQHGAGHVLWRIDRPVSNSGRLRGLLTSHALEHELPWEVHLDDDPDRVLGAKYDLVVSADAAVLDRDIRWANLASWIIDDSLGDAWIVPMTVCIGS
jgi:hypothetical protein